jgi:hypothetical protein
MKPTSCISTNASGARLRGSSKRLSTTQSGDSMFSKLVVIPVDSMQEHDMTMTHSRRSAQGREYPRPPRVISYETRTRSPLLSEEIELILTAMPSGKDTLRVAILKTIPQRGAVSEKEGPRSPRTRRYKERREIIKQPSDHNSWRSRGDARRGSEYTKHSRSTRDSQKNARALKIRLQARTPIHSVSSSNGAGLPITDDDAIAAATEAKYDEKVTTKEAAEVDKETPKLEKESKPETPASKENSLPKPIKLSRQPSSSSIGREVALVSMGGAPQPRAAAPEKSAMDTLKESQSEVTSSPSSPPPSKKRMGFRAGHMRRNGPVVE